jgi:hypothetical protein
MHRPLRLPKRSESSVSFGNDHSLPPADPTGTERDAGFADQDASKIPEENALTLMPGCGPGEGEGGPWTWLWRERRRS